MATLLIMALPEESNQLFEKNKITPHYCGVGQVKAAFLTHKLISEFKPTRVINLGTAGSHELTQGSLVECTSFVQRAPHDFYPLKSKKISVPALTQLKQATCGTADFIDRNSSLTNCDVMDMEAYAMAYVCEQLSTPFTSIKYVTDNSNADLIQNWKTQLKISAEKLFEQFQKIELGKL